MAIKKAGKATPKDDLPPTQKRRKKSQKTEKMTLVEGHFGGYWKTFGGILLPGDSVSPFRHEDCKVMTPF
jgi:hypothetical protein